MRASGLSDEAAAIFQNEILLKEGNTTYWIPVQNVMLEAYKNEPKPGQMVDLYVILVGMEHLGPRKYECFFLANDFAAVHGEKR